MGSAASVENRSRLQNADRAELLNIWQDLSEEHRQLLLKALEVEDTKEIKEDANEQQKEKLQHLEEEMKEDANLQHEDLRSRQLKSLDVEDTKETRKEAKKEQQEESKLVVTDNLRDFFEKCYRQGGKFRHRHYKSTLDADLYTWRHRPTGIQVWQDAIDLTSGEGGRVYFHYTSELAFRNITEPSKKAAEVWASLNSDPGPKQNAWWGKGVYSVPKPPDEWRDCNELLDNNFRNMMLRDLAAKGQEFVLQEYPKRVSFCVPILIDAADAYDISFRATPEMQAAGKAPGVNLGDKLLNEPGKPPRCCVVLRVNSEDGVKHAQGQLLDALRRRAAASGDVFAKERLGTVLMKRGLYDEALPVLQEVLKIDESNHGPESENALSAMDNLAVLLQQMRRYGEAVELQRRVLQAKEAMYGPEHWKTVGSINNLANTLTQVGEVIEALELQQEALEIRIRTLGVEHPETLGSMNNLAGVLYCMGRYDEAAEIYQKVLEIIEKTLGAQHPRTLMSMTGLGFSLDKMGKHYEAAELLQNTLEIMQTTLGAEHPDTLRARRALETARRNMGNREETAKVH